MDRVPLSSSSLRSVGYDPDTQTLEIEFQESEAVYQYDGVPPEIHAGLRASMSPGDYFLDHIRNRYPTRRIRHEGYS